VFDVRLQTGVPPVQRIVLPALHCTHWPVEMLHAGNVVDGHALALALPLSPSHPTQVPTSEQTGFVGSFVQFAEVRHSTHVDDATSQNGVAAGHVVSSMHATQKPLLQTGVGELHCVLSVHCAAQTWLLQNGFVGSVQSVAAVAGLHSTQTLFVVSQTGLPGMAAHAVASLALHCSHVPGPVGEGTQAGSVVVGHAEVAPELWLPLHCTHVLLVQTGLAAGHVLLLRQFTHTFVLVSQTVLVGSFVHATVPLHSPHAPLGRHAGFADVHGNLFVGLDSEPKSPVQPTQRF
jgi:hypothetical protein